MNKKMKTSTIMISVSIMLLIVLLSGCTREETPQEIFCDNILEGKACINTNGCKPIYDIVIDHSDMGIGKTDYFSNCYDQSSNESNTTLDVFWTLHLPLEPENRYYCETDDDCIVTNYPKDDCCMVRCGHFAVNTTEEARRVEWAQTMCSFSTFIPKRFPDYKGPDTIICTENFTQNLCDGKDASAMGKPVCRQKNCASLSSDDGSLESMLVHFFGNYSDAAPYD